MVGKCLNRFILLHLKYENKNENDKNGQENMNSIRLNTENDTVRFSIFPFGFGFSRFQQQECKMLLYRQHFTQAGSRTRDRRGGCLVASEQS
jgi:hypothetical protein